MTESLSRERLQALLLESGGDEAISCAGALRTSEGTALLVPRQAAETLAVTFAAKYGRARELGHAVVGLEEVLEALHAEGERPVRGTVVQSDEGDFIVVLNLGLTQVLGVMRVKSALR